MKFHLLTIFPEYFNGPFDHGVVSRAARSGALEIHTHDLRNWTHDVHRTVDDRPFGGGEGMLLKPEPIFSAVETIWPERGSGRKVVLLSAQGQKFTQAVAREFAALDELLLICGRYEGVDERVAEHLADEEISIGDYVLSGGEPAAAVVIDAVARLLPDVLGNSESAVNESFEDGHPRLPAMDSTGRVPGVESAGSSSRRKSCRDPEMAPRGGAGKNKTSTARFTGQQGEYRDVVIGETPLRPRPSNQHV